MSITLTDAEQRFADSPEGLAAIAYERAKHHRCEAWKGADAKPWTDAMEASTVRRLCTQHARQTVETAATLADAARREPIERAKAETARHQMIERNANAWRSH